MRRVEVDLIPLSLQIAPTVMDGITWDAPVMQQEIFGPVLGGILNTFFATFSGIWDSIKQVAPPTGSVD